MRVTETLHGWDVVFDDYDGADFYPDVAAKECDETLVVDVDEDTVLVEWDERSDDFRGTATRRCSIPRAVLSRLLQLADEHDARKDGES